MPSLFIAIAAANGLLGVILGAFGAHGLRDRMPADLMAIYQTGVQYQMYHALALFGVGILCLHYGESALLRASGWSFLAGIIIFSGSLYVLSLTGVRWLGAITPIGGLGFIAGWTLLIAAVLMNRSA